MFNTYYTCKGCGKNIPVAVAAGIKIGSFVLLEDDIELECPKCGYTVTIKFEAGEEI